MANKSSAKQHRKMTKSWFVKTRWSYLPNSWQAWLIYIPYILFLFYSLQGPIKNEQNILDTLYAIFPYWVSAAVVMTWIANNKSE